MEKKNRFKLVAMAGTCAVCIMVPASMAFSDYSEELSVDSYYSDILDVVSRQDALNGSDTDILLDDYNSGSSGTEDDILLSGGTNNNRDELLLNDTGSYSSYGSSDDILTAPSTGYNPSSFDGDLLLTTPAVTTPTPTPKPADARTVKAAMEPVTGSSSKSTDAATGNDGTVASASTIDSVIREVNARRAAAGVAPVTGDSTLNYVAAQRVKEITKKFSHTRPNGRESVTILSEYGVKAGRSGENIACCISSAEGAVAAWANSPTHKRCMLNSDYTHAGVGTTVSDGCTYWVLILTN